MGDRITIEGQDGTFNAYISRPKTLPAPAVVVLQELFGVNADIRMHCDELAEQGFLAVAPDLFWRQEPGVDAAVAYHGGDTEKYLGEVDGLRASILMHLAEEDEFISKAAQAKIKAALARKPNAMVYSYAGQRHAFSRHNGTHYNAAAAHLANGRTSEFLAQQLR
jgi:dienelactone hydrolase